VTSTQKNIKKNKQTGNTYTYIRVCRDIGTCSLSTVYTFIVAMLENNNQL